MSSSLLNSGCILIVNNEPLQFGQGNEIKGSLNLRLSKESFDSIGNMDFAACDNSAAEETYNRQPPVEFKLKASADLIPEAFKLNLYPSSFFSFKLN